MLMRVGGTFTVIMAGAGFTPEEVAAKNPGLISEDELLKIMTGSDPTVPVATLAQVAEIFGATLVVSLSLQSGAPAAPSVVATPQPTAH